MSVDVLKSQDETNVPLLLPSTGLQSAFGPTERTPSCSLKYNSSITAQTPSPCMRGSYPVNSQRKGYSQSAVDVNPY